jgi:acetate kinase
MHILVLNPGSSTLKYRLLDLVDQEAHVLTEGLVDHVQADSMRRAVEDALGRCGGARIDAIGCRVVHGGERFSAPIRVDESVIRAIGDLRRLAPLHNPPASAVLETVVGRLPGTPVVAVFDTAFHRTLPEVAALYALPLELTRDKGLHRYGAHGTSHRFVSGRLLERWGRPREGARLITCHLGNGASLCAVRSGQSVDTSMGLTPLEGLVMGTRSGDVDPGLLLYLLREEKFTADALDDLLNHKSGLLGLGGHADVRDLTKAAEAGDDRARLALEVFCYRVRKYIGAFTAVLEGVDAIAFTAGIGEHSALVRSRVCTGLGWLGVRLDAGVNEHPGAGEVCISRADSAVAVWVIPTDEERQIAWETAELLGRGG